MESPQPGLTATNNGTASMTREKEIQSLRKWKILDCIDDDLLAEARLISINRCGMERADKPGTMGAVIVTHDDHVIFVGGSSQMRGKSFSDPPPFALAPASTFTAFVSTDVRHENNVTIPREFSGLAISEIAHGLDFVIVRTNMGEIYVWGCYDRYAGCLHEFKFDDHNVLTEPTRVTGILEKEEIVQICSGLHHILYVTKTGKVITSDFRSSIKQPKEVQMPPGVQVKRVLCTAFASFVETLHGEFLWWRTDYDSRNEVCRCGRVCECSARFKKPNRFILPGAPRVIKVSCGNSVIVALTARRDIYICGWNAFGEAACRHTDNVDYPTLVTTIPSTERILDIEASGCTVACRTETKFYVWGYVNGKSVSEPQEINATDFDTVFAACDAGMKGNWKTNVAQNGDRMGLPLHSLFTDPNLADFAFEVEGKVVPAIKFFLRRCPLIREKLEGEWTGHGVTNPVVIPDSSYDAFLGLIIFLHSDEMATDEKSKPDLLVLAHRFGIQRLVSKVASSLESSLNTDNAISVYKAAIACKLPILRLACLEFIAPQILSVVMKEEDLSICEQLLQELRGYGITPKQE